MTKVQGNKNVALIECINPVKNKYRVRWGIVPIDDEQAEYYEEEFLHKPSAEDIKSLIINWYNQETDKKILSDFVWKDMSIWLSSENQFNYKVAYDLAVQTSGNSLPVTFKFGTEEKPIYYTFSELEELTDFFRSSVLYIQKMLSDGWNLKNSFNVDKYII